MSIQPLPKAVIAQIKSSTTITSLNGVVFELMQNSLDAGSTTVDISIDYSRGGCIVEDDGLGILPSEFRNDGGLGKLYHSSKLNSQTHVHGGCGTFLASLSAMSLLSITSQHHLYRSHNALSMHKSEVVSRQVSASAQQYLSRFSHGTRVTVRNLFGNMPVRVKQRAIIFEKQGETNKEWQSLKRALALLLLAWPNFVALTLRDVDTNQKMIIRCPSNLKSGSEVPRVCHILSQASFITSDEKDAWVFVDASTDDLNISGMISLDPSPTKNVQFLSFGIQPLLALEGQSILHDEINRLILNSAFGNKEERGELEETELGRQAKSSRDGYTNKELKGGKKGVNRWPMFYINIQRKSPSNISDVLDIDNIDGILDGKGKRLTSITELLQALIIEFLTRHHFRPKAPRGRRPSSTTGAKKDTADEEKTHQRDRKTDHIKHSSSGKGSPPSSAVARKGTMKIQSTDSDFLGATVKLPSFHRSSPRSESPFDGWTRIKNGAAHSALGKTNVLLSSEGIQRPSTAPPHSVPVTLNPPRPFTPLISSFGKVIRRPFDDISTQSSWSKHTPFQLPLKQSLPSKQVILQHSATGTDLTQGVGDDEDEMVAWINPKTKVSSIINKRTGHAAPSVNSKTARLSIRSSLIANPPPEINLSKSHIDVDPSETSPWLTTILEKWDNPIFRPTEPSILRISLHGETEPIPHRHQKNCSQLDIDRTFSEASSSIGGRISKTALKNADVIGQVDRKFILVKFPTSKNGKDLQSGKMLAVMDQHAADERIRVENLLGELCTTAPPRLDGIPRESRVATIHLEKGITFEVSSKDTELLALQKPHFADWGILYDMPSSQQAKPKTRRPESKPQQTLTVRALPPAIAERCKSDPKLLLDLIRTELYSANKPSALHIPLSPTSHSSSSSIEAKFWLSRIATCPPALLSMINSRACRSSIMFNDVLTKEQCETLVKRLADTAFPFQCAHGRPSLLPLVELGGKMDGIEDSGERDERAKGFGREFRLWKNRIGK